MFGKDDVKKEKGIFFLVIDLVITLVTFFKKTSLMVHLVVKNLPMTQVPSLVQEYSTCCRATKPVYHNL